MLDSLALETTPIIFDVGAHTGKYSRRVSELGPRVQILAFEPSAFTRARFDPQLVGHVEMIPCAVSDEVGSAMLYFDSCEQVEVITLDSFCDYRNLKPYCIKIDVEGHELRVLQGATKTLETTYVVQWKFGGSSLDSRTFFKDFYDFFTECGFLLYRMSPIGLIPVTRYSEELEQFVFQNWIALNHKLSGLEAPPDLQ